MLTSEIRRGCVGDGKAHGQTTPREWNQNKMPTDAPVAADAPNETPNDARQADSNPSGEALHRPLLGASPNPVATACGVDLASRPDPV